MFVSEKPRIADSGSIRENTVNVIYPDEWAFKTAIPLVKLSLSGRIGEDDPIVQISGNRATKQVRNLTVGQICTAYQCDTECCNFQPYPPQFVKLFRLRNVLSFCQIRNLLCFEDRDIPELPMGDVIALRLRARDW